MAGLWAARICADHFEDVLIIEPEGCLHTEEARFDPMGEKENGSLSARELKRTRVGHYGATHGSIRSTYFNDRWFAETE